MEPKKPLHERLFSEALCAGEDLDFTLVKKRHALRRSGNQAGVLCCSNRGLAPLAKQAGHLRGKILWTLLQQCSALLLEEEARAPLARVVFLGDAES
jgi:hypothetical protein